MFRIKLVGAALLVAAVAAPSALAAQRQPNPLLQVGYKTPKPLVQVGHFQPKPLVQIRSNTWS